ncbi:MAG: family 10 glycosylhydrolase [Anaerolineae bacterium]
MNVKRSEAEIIISDMSACKPAEGISREWHQNAWRLIDYETYSGIKGTMVYAHPDLGAPELELPLNVNGPYQIYLGIHYPKSRFGTVYEGYSPYGNLDVKLTDDLGFTHVAAEQAPMEPPNSTEPVSKLGKGKNAATSIQETYWKTADLTGQSLIFRPVGPPFNCPKWQGIANLSYVRLVPLTPEDEKRWQQLQPREDTRRVAYLYCAGHLSGHIDTGPGDFHPTSLDWFKDELAPIVNTDIGLLSLELIRGNYCAYRTRIGDVGGPDNVWQEEWFDPLAAFTELGHQHGLKVLVAMRMIGGAYPTSLEPLSWARFFWAHQEWVKRDRYGAPTTSLSIAYPGVREYWLSLLREVLAYGIDGVTVYLHRFHPFVLYEEPVIQSFQAAFGEDPRCLPEDDPRWIQHGADYVTRFLREVRALLDEKPGRILAVTFYGGPSKYDASKDWHPIRYQCDVETWIREGLADYLFPTQYPWVSYIRKWSELAQGRVHIWPDLMPSNQPGEKFAEQAKMYYDAGADGICLRDAERRAPCVSEWAVQCRLGHREMLDYLIEKAQTYHQRVPLKYLMGFATRYSFNNFGAIDLLALQQEKSSVCPGSTR